MTMRKLSINTKVQRCKQVQVTTQLSTLSKTFIIKLDEITMTQLETIKRENTRPDFLKIKKKDDCLKMSMTNGNHHNCFVPWCSDDNNTGGFNT